MWWGLLVLSNIDEQHQAPVSGTGYTPKRVVEWFSCKHFSLVWLNVLLL
jgi:hypothetical protein